MARYYLEVAQPVGRRRVGGGKTLDDAKRNAARVLKKDATVERVTVTDEEGKPVGVVERKAPDAG